MGAGINALVLCLTVSAGVGSFILAAGIAAIAQTATDTLETLIRKEPIDWEATTKNLFWNFGTTVAGNFLGAVLVPTNAGWFQPQKFLSVFTGAYGQRILLQNAVGAGFAGGVNFVRNFDWGKIKRAIQALFPDEIKEEIWNFSKRSFVNIH